MAALTCWPARQQSDPPRNCPPLAAAPPVQGHLCTPRSSGAGIVHTCPQLLPLPGRCGSRSIPPPFFWRSPNTAGYRRTSMHRSICVQSSLSPASTHTCTLVTATCFACVSAACCSAIRAPTAVRASCTCTLNLVMLASRASTRSRWAFSKSWCMRLREGLRPDTYKMQCGGIHYFVV